MRHLGLSLSLLSVAVLFACDSEERDSKPPPYVGSNTTSAGGATGGMVGTGATGGTGGTGGVGATGGGGTLTTGGAGGGAGGAGGMPPPPPFPIGCECAVNMSISAGCQACESDVTAAGAPCEQAESDCLNDSTCGPVILPCIEDCALAGGSKACVEACFDIRDPSFALLDTYIACMCRTCAPSCEAPMCTD